MRIFKFVTVCLFLCGCIKPLWAGDVSGEGYGKNKQEAKKEAFADLSSTIHSEVFSKFQSKTVATNTSANKYAQKTIDIRSNLPILGAECTFKTTSEKEILAHAILSPQKALKLYDAKLSELAKEIESRQKTIAKNPNSTRKYDTYTRMLTDLKQFSKYRLVATFLESKNIPKLSVTSAHIQEELSKLTNEISSLDLAARLLCQDIKYSPLFLLPPNTKGSEEITQFASVIRDKMAVYVKPIAKLSSASYLMTGKYEVLKNAIHLTYYINDTSGNTLITRVVKIAKQAYKGLRFQAQTIDFNKLLHSGVVVSSDFKVEINTNKGKRDLLFKQGESLKLFVKTNRPAYFFIVEHILKSKEKHSCLLELQENTKGKRKFLHYVNADDVNKWISLGEFEVVAPFGTETLHIFASNTDLVDFLPKTWQDSKSGLYIVSKSPKEGVKTSRGLIKKKKKKEKLTAESFLTFTSMVR